jgi:Fe-S cluster biosynthesis and repair protein YggX
MKCIRAITPSWSSILHSFKGYRKEAWNVFYVFDVFNDETQQYVAYDTYAPLLNEFDIDYITPMAIATNADPARFLDLLAKNTYLCPDGGEPGEGIVIKNYDFHNKFGEQVWAKIIRNEFKELHHRIMGAPEHEGLLNEDRIVNAAVSLHLIEKTICKIVDDNQQWSSKMIPQLFERVFYDVVKEELWDQWKKVNFASINGKTLKALTIQKIKQLKPELF